ncbi:MAG TPA: hypothetical protein VF276_04875, partial [Chloroflexia bacterium]
TGSDDKTARLWSAKTGQLLQTFTETSRVWGVAFSPDSRRALLALADGTGRILDLTTGVEVRRLLGHTNSLLSGVFSPDGKLVLTTSADMTARVWQVDYRDSLQALCARLTRDFSDAERAKYEIADKTPTCPGP